MKRLLIYGMLLFMTFLGCSRRPLTEDLGAIAMVPIHIDWSKSTLKVEDIFSVTVRVIPHNGAKAYSFIMQSNKTDDVIPLAVGTYSFVIFNETLNPEDWESLTFEGIENYDSFTVCTNKDAFKGLYSSKADDVETRKSPDNIAVWSIDNFEVTQDMIIYTRALSKGEPTKSILPAKILSKVELEMSRMLTITPLPVTRKVNILARVENLSSATRSSGALTNLVGAIKMSTRKPTSSRINHIFIMNGRVYDDPSAPKHGTIGASLYIFDQSQADDLQANFHLDFLLSENIKENTVPTYIYDVTKDLKKDDLIINLRFGFMDGLRPDDKPIILPDIPGSEGVGVDDWDDVIVPLK